jgi:hypothetical protein
MNDFLNAIYDVWNEIFVADKFTNVEKIQTQNGQHHFFFNGHFHIRFSKAEYGYEGYKDDVEVSIGSPSAELTDEKWHFFSRPYTSGDKWIHFVDLMPKMSEEECDSYSEEMLDQNTGTTKESIGNSQISDSDVQSDARSLIVYRNLYIQNRDAISIFFDTQ